ncbi:hypothetical protein [Salinisphaera orenii]|uniref:hypothetical protein n=1 Tax=Salinisphaera orenii TaxID=856731 RepID=UPI0013A66AD9
MSVKTPEPRYAVIHVAETIRGGIASYLREVIPRQVTRYGDTGDSQETRGQRLGDSIFN